MRSTDKAIRAGAKHAAQPADAAAGQAPHTETAPGVEAGKSNDSNDFNHSSDFNAVVDISDIVRRQRSLRLKLWAMRVVIVLLVLAAVGVGGFPLALQYRSARDLANTSTSAAERVAGWPYPQAETALEEARAYNTRLAESGQAILGEAADPFSAIQDAANGETDGETESASQQDEEYQSLLDSGGGVMGTIRIPKISVELPIYHGTSETALASGAGHLYGTSLPVGGENTHSVITGHRGLVEAAMFTRLDEMEVGDYFYIEVMGETLGYQVDRITVIEPDDTSQLKIVSGEDRVTLMTCTPYGVNTHRLLVSAVRSSIPDVIPAEEDAAVDARSIAIGVGLGVLVFGLLLVGCRRSPWHIRRHADWWPKRG
ncbi:sortase [Bifidobacterium eulemuris]|uniref:Sortase n=1 Tax=Bifidobacterium eulemuris TaxID=1765219 RepID=A0A261GDK2_9BIFI|nr:sortase [Bifidobacterium eulemuris]